MSVSPHVRSNFCGLGGGFFALKSGSAREQIGPSKQARSRNRPPVFTFLKIFDKGYEFSAPKSSRLNPGTPTGLDTSPGSSIYRLIAVLSVSSNIFVCLQKGVPCSAIYFVSVRNSGVGFSACSPQ
jgi:hypothetical protein